MTHLPKLIPLTATFVLACADVSPAPPREDAQAAALGSQNPIPNPQLWPWRSCPSVADFTANRPTTFAVDPLPFIDGISSCDDPTQLGRSPCTPHHVLIPASTAKSPLVVFMPGSRMEPDKHQIVLEAAAYAGFRTIGLSYDNTRKTSEACDGSTDDCDGDCNNNCHENVRREVLLGNTTTTCRDVHREDSVLVRLYRLLDALHTMYPMAGWDAYFTHTEEEIEFDDITWSNIIVAGFSQGAGEAALISMDTLVEGVVMIEGPGDTCDADQAATWLSGPDASIDRPRFGVYHARNGRDATLHEAWANLGMGSYDHDLDHPTFDVIDTHPPVPRSSTNQGVHPGCGAHATPARIGCMTTDLSGQTPALTPDAARLFGPYVNRFCHACDAATCP